MEPQSNCKGRWLDAQTFNLDEVLAGSGVMSDWEIFEKLTSLFVIMPTNYLLYGYMRCDTNKLKMHPTGGANIKKVF